MWVFGYGSLIWRTGFAHLDARACFIQGYRRRFWQGSTDHRGVPEAPGRVVTLERDADARCWGMAFRIAAAEQSAVLAALDHREKGGYQRALEPVREAVAAEPFAEALLYVAQSDNPNYLGPAPLADIARQAQGAHGPSGSNIEYVRELAAALRRIAESDAERFDRDVLELDQLLGRVPSGE